VKILVRPSAVTAMLAIALLVVPLHGATIPVTVRARPEPVGDDSFPRLLPLMFDITPTDDRELRSFKELTVTVQEVEDEYATTLVGPVDPFTSANRCVRPMPPGLGACVVNTDATIGTLRVDWRIPRPGTYNVVISAKRGKADRPETLLMFHLGALPGA
jgi:hypothetical protein